MRAGLFFLLLVWSTLSWAAPEHSAPPLATVEVYRQDYDWLTPWNRKSVESETARAWQVQQGWWLTTADVVGNASLVQLRPLGQPTSQEAQIRFFDDDANLALLETASPDNTSTVTWGEATPGEATVAYFDHQGAQEGSITLDQLALGFRKQTDTWLPVYTGSMGDLPLTSGLPVLQSGGVIGMMVQRGSAPPHLLPAQILENFVEQAHSGTLARLPQRGFNWGMIPQPSVAAQQGFPEDAQGAWITQVLESGTGSEVLQQFDLLTRINEWEVDFEGQIRHPQWGRVPLDVLLMNQFSAGDVVQLEVYRGSQKQLLTTTIAARQVNRHLPLRTRNQAPRYVLRGGLLFQELTYDYLSIWGERWADQAPVRLRLFPLLDELRPGNSNQRIVLLSQVLPDAINIGYEDLEHEVVEAVNGQPIHRLEDLLKALESPQGGYHRIEFMSGATRHQVVLPVDELPAAHQRLMRNYQIPALEHL